VCWSGAYIYTMKLHQSSAIFKKDSSGAMQFLLMTPAEQCNFFLNDAGGAMQFFFLMMPAEQMQFFLNDAGGAMQFFF